MLEYFSKEANFTTTTNYLYERYIRFYTINIPMLELFVLYSVNGTLAEGMSMTLDERKKSAEAWVKASDGKLVYMSLCKRN